MIGSLTTIKKLAVTTAALVGLAAPSLGQTAQAAGYSYIGNTTPDAAAQGVQMGAVTCSVTGGDPVVVTVNGVRHVRSTAFVSCNSPVHVYYAGSGLYTNGTVVAKRTAAGPYWSRTSLSIVSERACNGSANRYWTGIGEFKLDMNRDGVVDAFVQDASLANLRSCGL